MSIVEELQRDHHMLREKMELLHSAVALAPDAWFVLRESGFVLRRRLQTHSEREAQASAACHAPDGNRVLAHVMIRHQGSLQALAQLNRLLMAEQPEQSLEAVRTAVRAVIVTLKRECNQQEAYLFPLLAQFTDAPAPPMGAVMPPHLDETTVINRVLCEYPQAQSVFERHGVNLVYEGYDRVDEVAWRHGLTGGEFLAEMAVAIRDDAPHAPAGQGGIN